MPKGFAVCLGLNSVSPDHYGGWKGELRACEADAKTMARIASASGFSTVNEILTTDAKRGRVQQEIEQAAQALNTGDIFLLSYSGHGGQLPDLNGDEPDSLDETWCLYDGELVDDEVYSALCAFKPGVRILIFTDSCHSGTNAKETMMRAHYATNWLKLARSSKDDLPEPDFKAMPGDVAQNVYYKNQSFYDAILGDKDIATSKARLQTQVIHFGACQDNQLSKDGIFNGAFTGRLISVWNAGKFEGNYSEFAKKIGEGMRPDQTPNFDPIGPSNSSFLGERPFTV